MSDDQQSFAETQSQQLREHYNELAALAGSLAHEIKNPLSVIRMNADLLGEDVADSDSPQSRRFLDKLDIVQEQCERLENLLNDFLQFARLRGLDLRPGSLNRQVEKVLDLFEAQADQESVRITRYLDPDLPAIRLEEKTLQAALVNLTKNAFEAMPTGGELVARTYSTRSGVALDLIDSGCGMDQATALKMFNAFYSTKDGGSGLGLPTTRKIIEAHDALIQVQSEMGTGTKFTLEFPRFARITE